MTEEPTPTGFADLGLRDELLATLNGLGYEEPTPIQREAIPHLVEGRDLLGQAATGTGKTAAFALPILQRLRAGRVDGPFALVLVPTRELAMQVSEAIYRYGHDLGANTVPIYGGQHIGRQLDALRRGAHVVVATPGRALDHIRRGSLDLTKIEMVVLDEADEMLDMGFAEDLDAILEATPTERQTVLFSATMPPRLTSITRNHLKNPIKITIERERGAAGTTPKVTQRLHRPSLPQGQGVGSDPRRRDARAAIVFCRTRGEVDQLTETLNGRGYRAEALHGGMDQEQRDRVMGRLRSGVAELLCATDVAARGLDIDHLTHVVNYDVPSSPETYVHRIGRVGRAGREGIAITLAEPRERRLLGNIERLTGTRLDVGKVPSVAQLREKRIERTVTELREALDDDSLEQYRDILTPLNEDHELEAIALAALKLVHELRGGEDDAVEIPDFSEPRRDDRPRDRYDRGAGSPRGRNGEGHGFKEKRGPNGSIRFGKSDRPEPERQQGIGRLYVGAGRSAGVRPQDLVGAIANETRLNGKDIGAIKVGDHFSIVEVPERSIDEVISLMADTTIKGRKAKIRRFVETRH
ncbi:MAG: DEAD/DEAH box helicase [Ilumatobacteraceae bacterium]